MVELGFNVVCKKKGTYVDGHKRDDIVEYRKTFFCVGWFLSGFLMKVARPPKRRRKLFRVKFMVPRMKLLKKPWSSFMMSLLSRPMTTSLHSWQNKVQP